jgi:hypothetical protein
VPLSAADPSERARRVERARRRARARVEANARLTAATAAVLLVLLAIEGVTVVRIHQLLTWHVVVGMILVPPVLVKMGSTGWRFARYYAGHPAYREKGPPAPLLRLLGPFVVMLTVVMLASGIALLLDPHGLGGRLLLVHKASFVLWFGAMTIHVLGHLAETGRLAARDWRPRTRSLAPGARARTLLLVVSLAVGVALGVALLGRVAPFQRSFYRQGACLPGCHTRLTSGFGTERSSRPLYGHRLAAARRSGQARPTSATTWSTGATMPA